MSVLNEEILSRVTGALRRRLMAGAVLVALWASFPPIDGLTSIVSEAPRTAGFAILSFVALGVIIVAIGTVLELLAEHVLFDAMTRAAVLVMRLDAKWKATSATGDLVLPYVAASESATGVAARIPTPILQQLRTPFAESAALGRQYLLELLPRGRRPWGRATLSRPLDQAVLLLAIVLGTAPLLWSVGARVNARAYSDEELSKLQIAQSERAARLERAFTYRTALEDVQVSPESLLLAARAYDGLRAVTDVLQRRDSLRAWRVRASQLANPTKATAESFRDSATAVRLQALLDTVIVDVELTYYHTDRESDAWQPLGSPNARGSKNGLLTVVLLWVWIVWLLVDVTTARQFGAIIAILEACAVPAPMERDPDQPITGFE